MHGFVVYFPLSVNLIKMFITLRLLGLLYLGIYGWGYDPETFCLYSAGVAPPIPQCFFPVGLNLRYLLLKCLCPDIH